VINRAGIDALNRDSTPAGRYRSNSHLPWFYVMANEFLPVAALAAMLQ
jgi:hypothetical protein